MIQINNHNITDIEIDGHIITTIDIIVNGQSRRVFYKIAPSHTFIIVGADDLHGESGSIVAAFDGVDVTTLCNWTINADDPSAIQYNEPFDGSFTITNSTHVEFNAEYRGYNATKSIEIHYEPGKTTDSTVTTETDPDTGETIIIETTTIDNGDGSSQVSQTTTYEDGSYSQTETQNNSDSSSSTQTINYDANGDPESGSNNTIDTQGNSNTQEITYQNGDPVVTGYTIDTSDNPNGGETLNNSNIDTGMIVFDGRGFEMNLVFKCKCTENAGNAIFAAMENTSGKKYSGFNFTIYRAPSTSDWYIYAGTDSNLNTSTGVFGSQVNGSYPFRISSTNSQKVTQYTMVFRYLPANYGGNTSNYGQVYVELSPITTGQYYATSPYTKVSTVIPALLNNATFTLGGNGFTTQQNMVNFEVISFNVQKI